MKKKNARLPHLIFAGVQNMTFKIKKNTRSYFLKIKYLLYKLVHWNIDLNYFIRYQKLVFDNHAYYVTDECTRWHLVIEATQGE